MSQKSVNPNQILLTPQKHGIRTNNKYVTLKCNGNEQKYITKTILIILENGRNYSHS